MKAFGIRIGSAFGSLSGGSASAEDQPAVDDRASDQNYSKDELQRVPAREPGKRLQTAPLASVVRTMMQMVVSLLVLGAGLYMILSGQFGGDAQKWAYGVIGVVVGYWLS
jgi:hypothetical protein